MFYIIGPCLLGQIFLPVLDSDKTAHYKAYYVTLFLTATEVYNILNDFESSQ
jgi:hypothetical protein